MDKESTNMGEAGKSSSEERTFTQEEMNQIVGSRVAIEKSKYADYDELKAKAAKFDEYEEKNKSELERVQEQNSKLQSEIEKYKKAESLRTVHETVAKKMGVPANLLHGSDEESCEEEAKAILEFAGSRNSRPKRFKDKGDHMDHEGGGTPEEDFRDFFDNYF